MYAFSTPRQIQVALPHECLSNSMPNTLFSSNLMILSLLPLFLASAEKEHTIKLIICSVTLSPTLLSHTLHTPLLLFTSYTMPGPDPRRTKPSAYTIPKAGTSKSVSHRPPLHASTGATATAAKDDNPRPLTHQEVRRGKSQKPPIVNRTSARLSGTRRSPRHAPRSRVASLKRPDKYDPKSCLLYTSPSPRDRQKSRMPSSA